MREKGRETQQMELKILEFLKSYDRAALTPEQQLSYDVYLWYLEDLAAGHEFMYYNYPATHFLVGSVPIGTEMFFSETFLVTDLQSAQDYVTLLSQVGTKFEQLVEGLKLREEAGIVPPLYTIQWALYNFKDYPNMPASQTPYYTALQEKMMPLSSITPEEQQQLLDQARAAIEDSVLPGYAVLVEQLQHMAEVASTDDGVWQFENGEAYYSYLLRHHNNTDFTAEEIHDLGLKELDRIHAEMREIFESLGYDPELRLSALYAKAAEDGGFVPGEELVTTYEAIIDEVYENLDDAFDIQPEAKVIVIGGPTGGYYIPGSFDGARPGAFYASVDGGGRPYYGMPSLTYHESVPGHHFQIALAQESDLPLFRNVIGLNGYVEGWALYAERLAWDLGWYQDDPYGNLGRLQYEAFRAARLVVDTGIHSKGWTQEHAIVFFMDNAGYSRGYAEWQIARYTVYPAQSTAYMVGMLKILELRQYAMDELGDQFDLKEFHRVVLQKGSMPLSILEQVVEDYVSEKQSGG